MQERIAIGCMTGTSLDGLDVAAVRAIGSGLEMAIEPLGFVSEPLGALGPRLRRLASGEAVSAQEVADASQSLGELHAAAAEAVCGVSRVERDRLALVAAHGQTVWHGPPTSWQLLTPAVIAERCRCPVVSDLRAADLAAGGEGAPITPIADALLFAEPGRTVGVVNLGGFVNVTVLPPRPGGEGPLAPIDGGWLAAVRACDVCPCNHVLDRAARGWGAEFDAGGERAAAAADDADAFDRLGRALTPGRRFGRSLGTGDEAGDAVDDLLSGDHDPASVARESARAIAAATARAMGPTDRVLIAGGGAANRWLVRSIAEAFAAGEVVTTAQGATAVDPRAREAVAMAVLGLLSADGVPITLPQVTGCRRPAPRAGAWCLPDVPASATPGEPHAADLHAMMHREGSTP